jgi:glycosyltransferase involved in cell wall biosynthesis
VSQTLRDNDRLQAATPSDTPLLVSVVISTYRRQDMLRDALASMRTLAVCEGLSYELLVIDNDPQGSSREVVEETQAQWPAGMLRYVNERRPGLSHARNRGLDEARGEVVAFLDDDIFIDPQWLIEMIGCMRRHNADCVHGRTRVRWDGEPEPVVRACFDKDGNLGEFEIARRWLPGGGNMAVRRSLMAEGFRFSHGFGRVGKLLLSGEDTEVTRRMQAAGKRLWYCGAAVMHHRTGGERLTAAYYPRRAYWIGLSYALIDRKLSGRAYQVASAAARAVCLPLVTAPRWLAARLRGDEAGQMQARVYAARQIGYLRAVFSLRHLLSAEILNEKAEDRQKSATKDKQP